MWAHFHPGPGKLHLFQTQWRNSDSLGDSIGTARRLPSGGKGRTLPGQSWQGSDSAEPSVMEHRGNERCVLHMFISPFPVLCLKSNSQGSVCFEFQSVPLGQSQVMNTENKFWVQWASYVCTFIPCVSLYHILSIEVLLVLFEPKFSCQTNKQTKK